MYDIVIIGGGFYGCKIALHFKQKGKKVLVIEKEHDIMLRASFNNQARVHNGYHYPRAFMTAESSHRNYEKFVTEFSPAVKFHFLMTYAIAKGSKTDAKTFQKLYKKIGAPLHPAKKSVIKLLNTKLIEKAFTVEERVFDGNLLREIIRQRLLDEEIPVMTDTQVAYVTEKVVHLSNNRKIKTKRIINCTYANINNLLKASRLPKIASRIENTTMALIKVPRVFSNLGVTIMDGDFFAVMPFPAFNLHTIHHVKYTPMKGNHEKHMIEDVIRFLPILEKSEYVGRIKEKKTILLANEEDDGRPSLFKKDYGFPGFDIVLGSKLDTVYDILLKLDGNKKTNLNVTT